MRNIAISIFAAALLASPALAGGPDIHVDVPHRSGLEVNVLEYDIAPGQSSGWHKHAGYEIAYVLSGAANVRMGASPIRHVAEGSTFEVDRGTPHDVDNASTTAPLALLITLLKDKNAPWRTPAKPPAIR